MAMALRYFRLSLGILRLAGFLLSAWPCWIWIKLRGPEDERAKRAQWMRIMCRRALHILNCCTVTSGPVPGTGLIVANHLGYVDILALGSIMPAAFVAKKEVRGWPAFGCLASLGGTVFVDRDTRTSAARPLPEIEAILAAGVPVVLFPEGTSSDGSGVLPFRSALLAVVERSGCSTTPVGIRYFREDGHPNRDLAYHGDDHFIPHLLAALQAKRTIVQIQFGEPMHGFNRKELASRLHAAIVSAVTSSRSL